MSARARRGATLPGVLVGLALSTLVLALLGDALVTLLRQAHRQHDRAQARAQLAQAAGVLEAELRGLAARPTATDVGDLLLVADTAVELRAAVGGGVACAVDAGGVELIDAPAAGAPAVSWWADVPQPEDLVHVHDEGATPRAGDDAWHARAVVAVERGGGACAAGAFGGWAGASAPLRLRLAGPALPATVSAGAPVRVTRRRRYALYRDGDGAWQLGQRGWAGGATSLQPVAGPLAPAGGAGAGLTASAFDVGGAPARLSVTVRAERSWAGRRWRDSAAAHAVLDVGAAP